jgi:CHAT domain-containing protein/Tfp pilus assembly protein PilF
VDLKVEQHGADVEISLLTADGRRLTRVDSPNGKQDAEPLPLVMDGQKPRRLEILTGAKEAGGRYAIVITALRTATAADRIRVEADRVFAEGEELRHRGDALSLRAALEQDRRSLALLRSLPAAAADRGREADVLIGRATVHFMLDHGEEAVADYREALTIFRERGELRKTAGALNGLGASYRSLGEPRQAISFYREALKIYRSGGGPAGEGEGKVQHNLGRAYAALGEAEDALQAYDAALAVWQRPGYQGQQGETLRNRAELYLALGDWEKAVDSFDQALPLLKAAGRHREAARVLVGHGAAEVASGRGRQGLSSFEKALALQIQTGDQPAQIAVTQGNLCWALLSLDEVRSAEEPCARSLAFWEQLGDRANQGSALTNLGWLREQTGRLPEAVTLYQRALPILASAGDRLTETTTLLNLARALRRQGQMDAALRATDESLRRVESLREELGSPALRASFFATRQKLYSFFIDLLMELHQRRPAAGYEGRALAVSERARARMLLDLLGDTGSDPATSSPALLAQEREVGRRLDVAEQRRRWLEETLAPEPQQRAAGLEVRSLLAERERALAALHKTSPHQGPVPGPLGLREIQAQIDHDTLLLEIALGDERSFLWLVSAESLAAFPLPGRATLEEVARRAHSLLAADNISLARVQTDAALANLSRSVLGPVADRLGTKRLLIVSEGALLYVPFAALPDPAHPGEPLLAHHEIVTLPSVSSLAGLRRAVAGRPSAPATLAVLADPVFDLTDPRMAYGHWTRPAAARSGRFARLPFSSQEAEAILALVPPSERLGALGLDANRETATNGTLARYRILHFATHGILDTEHPDLSGIALSMIDGAGRPRNGFLRVHEIDRLRLPADLVVLSACATALGRELKGEGLVGLTQSFFHAGARSVLVSLWPVEDVATADLMKAFYQELLGNKLPPAAALRAAQLALQRRPDRSAPSSWAGFILLGDWKAPHSQR